MSENNGNDNHNDGRSGNRVKLKPAIRDRITKRASRVKPSGDASNGYGADISGDNGSTGTTTPLPSDKRKHVSDANANASGDARLSNDDTGIDDGSDGSDSRSDGRSSGRKRRTSGSNGGGSSASGRSDTDFTAKEPIIDNEGAFRVVNANDVFSDAETIKPETKTRGRKPKQDRVKYLKVGFEYLYTAPAVIGYGEHWILDDSESIELATSFNDVLNAFPTKEVDLFFKVLERYAPLFSFAIVFGMITWQRMKTTKRIINEQLERERERKQAEESGANQTN